MKIGLFSDCYLPTRNGVTTSLLHLKAGLEQQGHHVLLVTVAAPGGPVAEPGVLR
ncbi:MAG: glycosyltransferase family 4 protein, partial [Anaerolineae bacterium]|nr:glycosyltransferase family 4 protein [Anaerolineae bacterium]